MPPVEGSRDAGPLVNVSEGKPLESKLLPEAASALVMARTGWIGCGSGASFVVLCVFDGWEDAVEWVAEPA